MRLEVLDVKCQYMLFANHETKSCPSKYHAKVVPIHFLLKPVFVMESAFNLTQVITDRYQIFSSDSLQLLCFISIISIVTYGFFLSPFFPLAHQTFSSLYSSYYILSSGVPSFFTFLCRLALRQFYSCLEILEGAFELQRRRICRTFIYYEIIFVDQFSI